MNALTPVAVQAAPLSTGLMPTNMDQAIRLAEMMATAKLVPSHLQGKAGDCLMVIEAALRWNMSPFAVAQATSVIGGKLMYEGKLVSAAVQTSGLLATRLSHEFDGQGESRAVTASATLRGETEPRTIRCTLAEAKTSNGMWVKQPDQQLVYFSSRAWARRHAPEVMLGVYSPEEFDAASREQRVLPTTPPTAFQGPTIDAKPEPAPAEPKAEPRRTWRTLIDDTRGMLAACRTTEEVVAVADIPAVRRALEVAPEPIQREFSNLLADAYARTNPPDDAGGFDDAIPGEAMAGA